LDQLLRSRRERPECRRRRACPAGLVRGLVRGQVRGVGGAAAACAARKSPCWQTCMHVLHVPEQGRPDATRRRYIDALAAALRMSPPKRPGLPARPGLRSRRATVPVRQAHAPPRAARSRRGDLYSGSSRSLAVVKGRRFGGGEVLRPTRSARVFAEWTVGASGVRGSACGRNLIRGCSPRPGPGGLLEWGAKPGPCLAARLAASKVPGRPGCLRADRRIKRDREHVRGRVARHDVAAMAAGRKSSATHGSVP